MGQPSTLPSARQESHLQQVRLNHIFKCERIFTNRGSDRFQTRRTAFVRGSQGPQVATIKFIKPQRIDALKSKRVVDHASVKPPGGPYRGEIANATQQPQRHARGAATPFGNRLQRACGNSIHPQQPGSARQDGHNVRHRIEAQVVRNSKA